MTLALWRVWLREYGAAGAIALALRHGYTRQEILEVNRELRSIAMREAGSNACQ